MYVCRKCGYLSITGGCCVKCGSYILTNFEIKSAKEIMEEYERESIENSSPKNPIPYCTNYF